MATHLLYNLAKPLTAHAEMPSLAPLNSQNRGPQRHQHHETTLKRSKLLIKRVAIEEEARNYFSYSSFFSSFSTSLALPFSFSLSTLAADGDATSTSSSSSSSQLRPVGET